MFAVIAAAVAAMPLLWRVAVPLAGYRSDARASYLPTLEATRVRRPFDPAPLAALRARQPRIVIIGDSMTGRIHYPRLIALAGGDVMSVHANSTGSAYWYLTFKNYVVASGVRPDWVLVFFRDTQLTDPLFRLTERNRPKVDTVALDKEEELNRVIGMRARGVWNSLHERVDETYGVEPAREWLEPLLTAWPARVVAGNTGRDPLLGEVNEAFALNRLRPFAQADVEDAPVATTDFHANVEASVLPLFIALSREQHIRLCFIRVLRRPANGQPPRESGDLRQYVRDLAAYLEAQNVAYIDDRTDPALARFSYADGDHVADDARLPYTERLWPKLQARQ